MNNFTRNRQIVLSSMLASLLILALLWVVKGTAQPASPVPIQSNQNTIGEVTAEQPMLSYAFSASGGEIVTFQVLAISTGFAPHLRLVNAAGVEMLVLANPDDLISVSGNRDFGEAGVYTVEVSGEHETLGQFVLALQPGATAEPTLLIDQLVTEVVGVETPLHAYRFAALEVESVPLTLTSETVEAGVLVTLYDETLHRTIASSDAGLNGLMFRFPPGDHAYRLDVRTSSSNAVRYTLCLGACGDAPATTPALATVVTPEVDDAAGCLVFSNANGSVNVRSGPGRQYAIMGTLALGQSYPVVGQFVSGGWYEVSLNGGQFGWVYGAVTRLEGDCTGQPSVAAPANAPLAPTQPAPTLPPPTSQPNSGGGSSPTPTSEERIVETQTPTEERPQTLPATPVVPPDLELALNEFTISEDGSASISYALFNRFAIVESVFIRFCVNNSQCSTDEVTGIPSNIRLDRTATFSVPYDAHFPRYTLTVTIDPDNLIAETEEDDNVETGECMPNTTGSLDGTGPCE